MHYSTYYDSNDIIYNEKHASAELIQSTIRYNIYCVLY